MTTNPLFYDAPAKASMDALTARLNSGFLQFFTGAQPALDGALTGTLLASLALSATAFAASTASAGTVTATANAITSANASATGTAGYFALLRSDGVTVEETGTVGTSASDMNMNTTAFVSGVNVSVSALTITQPQT